MKKQRGKRAKIIYGDAEPNVPKAFPFSQFLIIF